MLFYEGSPKITDFAPLPPSPHPTQGIQIRILLKKFKI